MPPLDDQDSFLELPCGRTRVRFDGAPGGSTVVLIHGATVPHWEFDRITPYLSAAGYRVARFDLLGHGESARPRTRYRHELFVDQARAFFEHAGLVARDTAVLGHSMGAAIAASLAVTHPPAALILVAPMLDFSAVNRFSGILSLPVAGELFMAMFGRRFLIRRRNRRYQAIGLPELAEKFRAQVRVPGFWRALVSMERHGALGDQSRAYRAAARAGLSPLILRGADDPIVPYADIDRIEQFFAHARREELADLAHNLMLTAPERVAPLIIAHLDQEFALPAHAAASAPSGAG